MSETSQQQRTAFQGHDPTWCPGCGNFGIWTALKGAFTKLGKKPDEVVIVYGIGCSGNEVNTIRSYGFHGLHGRALPVAEGIRLANHELPVIVVGGDGDGLGEGMGHFIHAMRSNPNVTYLLHDNQVYGLTRGQHSPTARRGFVSTTAPSGVLEEPVNPIALALTVGASFIARGFAGDATSLEELIVEGVEHNGFSFIDILQPCTTYNHENTFLWYHKRAYELSSVNHDPSDFTSAWDRAHEVMDEKIPVGIFYRRDRPTIEQQQPALAKGTLVSTQPDQPVDITSLLKAYQ